MGQRVVVFSDHVAFEIQHLAFLKHLTLVCVYAVGWYAYSVSEEAARRIELHYLVVHYCLHVSLIELEARHAVAWFRALSVLDLSNNETESSNPLRRIG
jgi:hypothetical protein